MLSRLRHWSQHLAARLPAALPSPCALCGGSAEDALCSGCRAQFFGQPRRRCVQCAVPLAPTDAPTDAASAARCGACLRQPPAFDATIVAADYTAPLDQLVLALKFGHRLALAPLLARALRDALLQTPHRDNALPDVLSAVPLGSRRLAERGFNQALEIAKPLARALGIALEPTLTTRLRETQAQSMLHPEQRHDNMRQAFTLAHHAVDRVRGRHVGVVDDVITTGETLNELAATLKRFGAARVTNFVFARTLPKP